VSIPRYPLRLAVITVVAALLSTLTPLFLPVSWQKLTEFFHWPMLLIDRSRANWLPLNAGKRIIVLFLINVVGWAVAMVFLRKAGKIVVRRERVLLRD
jgi:hypothetical protein